jgi:hypothetical protein
VLHGTLAFLLLVAFALLGHEVRNALARRGLRAPGMEGLSFLVVGFALGDRGLGLFPADLIAGLRPVVLLGLAWIGLVFGLQLDLRIIRQLKTWHRVVGVVVPTVIGAVITISGLVTGMELPLALGLGAVGSVSTPSTLESLARGRAVVDRAAFKMLKLITAFAGIPAVFALTVASALASPAGDASVPAWQLVVHTVLVGLVLGYAMVALIRGVREHLRLLTLTAGAAAAIAGITAVLGITGLPAAAVAGGVIVNRTMFPHRLLKVAHSLERPMLLALLVLVGASWRGAGFSLAAFVLLTVVRSPVLGAAGRWVTAVAGRRGLPVRLPDFGFGLLPQGELALGLLVALLGTAVETRGVLEAVVAAMVFNQVAGRVWLSRRLFSDGESQAGSSS